VYDCILNSRTEAKGEMKNRTAVMMDIYPTMLSAMGFTIEGDRLGLGTDLLSGRKTLAEEMGYTALNEEVQKYSQFFTDHFATQR
jgi:phosphoglycerol transferase